MAASGFLRSKLDARLNATSVTTAPAGRPNAARPSPLGRGGRFAVESYLENGCRREPVYEQRAQAAFAFRDRANCARTFDAISTLIETRGIH